MRGKRAATLPAGALALAVAVLVPASAQAGSKSASGAIGGDTQDSVSVGCAGDKRVIGGGVATPAFYGEVRINSASPVDGDDSDGDPDDLYEATVDNLTGSPINATAYAYCAKGDFSYRLKTTDPITSGGDTGSKACPRDEDVVGGGVVTSGDFNETWITGSFPSRGDSKDSWFGGFDEVDPGVGSYSATLLAVCSDNWSVKQRQVGTPGTVPPASRGSSTKACKAGETVIGGGLPNIGFGIYVAGSHPMNGWTVNEDNATGSDAFVLSRALCK